MPSHLDAGVARGMGPRWVRIGLAVLATCYYAALNKQPPQLPGLHAITFFTEAACLFPEAAEYVIELRLEVWSCESRAWQLADPRPYFPIEASSKESRFQRIGYFYQRNHEVLEALDAWLVARFADDGEQIGGVRIVKSVRPVPKAGELIERYRYDPLAEVVPSQRRDLYTTKSRDRQQRCK